MRESGMVDVSTVLLPVGIVGLAFGLLPLPGTGALFAVLVLLAGVALRLLGY